MLFRTIISCSVLNQALASGPGLPDEAALARQQAGAGKIDKDTIDAIFDAEGSLSAMWEREAKRAQLETRRFLGNQGSMPLIPSASPVFIPTAAPSVGRTLSPDSGGTFPPTLEGTFPPTVEGTFPPSTEGTPAPISGETLPPSPEGSFAPDSGVTPAPVSVTSLAPDSGGTFAPSPSQTSDGDCLEGTTLDAYLAALLSQITPEDTLLDPSTPQGKAVAAMLTDPFVEQNACSETLDQRYGLITFYYSTGGEEWSTQTSWLSDTDECTWFGVICDDADSRATNLTLGTWLCVSFSLHVINSSHELS